MTYIALYRLTNDSGFAPCIDKKLLTLACCKGGQVRKGKPVNWGLRFQIGNKYNGIDYTTDNVYILGTYNKKFLYIARVTKVVTMEEYFDGMADGRTDNIYSFADGKLIRNENLRKECVHTDELQNMRDIAGKYVLLSDDFVYLGRDAVYIDQVEKQSPVSRGHRWVSGEIAEQIVKECYKFRDGRIHKPTSPLKNHCGGCK